MSDSPLPPPVPPRPPSSPGPYQNPVPPQPSPSPGPYQSPVPPHEPPYQGYGPGGSASPSGPPPSAPPPAGGGRSKAPLVIGAVVVAALVAVLIFVLTKSDDKDSGGNPEASCKKISEITADAMKLQDEFFQMEVNSDADVPKAREAMLEILDKGSKPTIAEVRRLVTSFSSGDATRAVKEQAGAYLKALEQSEAELQSVTEMVNKATTLDDLQEIFDSGSPEDPASFENEEFAELVSAIRDHSSACDSAVDDVISNQ